MITEFRDWFIGSFYPPQYRLNTCKSDYNPAKRIEYIDLAKGVCILMVVLWHTGDLGIANFRALRMPLYFFLSGMFFKKYDIQTFLTKKANNIVIPFLFFVLLTGLWRIKHLALEWSFSNLFPLQEDENGIWNIYGNRALWFLVSLFTANIIYYTLSATLKKRLYVFISVCGLAAISYLLYLRDVTMPLWIDSTLSAMPFFFFGECVRSNSFIREKKSTRNEILVISVFLSFAYVLYFFYEEPVIHMKENLYQGNPVLAYINSLCMILGVLLLCKLIVWLPIISYVGRHSIILLGLHSPLLEITIYFERYLNYHPTHYVLTCVVVLICWLSIPILKALIPQFIAQKPLIKLPKPKPISA